MWCVVAAEWLKYRRTLTPWFVVGGPLLLALTACVLPLIAPTGRTWNLTLLTAFNWWVVLGVPLGSALIAALAASYERRAGAWRALRSRPLHPGRLYAAKYTVVAIHSAIAHALFSGFVVAIGGLIAWSRFWPLRGSIPWGNLVAGTMVCWASGLALLAVMLWCATAFPFSLTMAVGLIGTVSGVLTSETKAWVYVPWAWPVRALEPVFGFHANGLPLEKGSMFWNTGVIPIASGLGVVLAVAITALGAWWFSRTEVR
ncbi:multidrug ABC transporter permease [Alicyclobacillus cellulosilyticus]|uniref:Multidrug ABC transporter permease n=1 Tax=Alicyclobacillus cellulosilyticus TaxID=1003997 RepID=A0A917K0R4_9BACL|nr:lantibiotic immunity ABC transporter MutE/EpiE family permease subunit [Alicyclobacillus cellulosilyticus]GGI96579.1 multidrug ABC transporter permease [Alicyclobacillus cellulosilyticus]